MSIDPVRTSGVGPVSVTFIGVRHHSPACARLVRDTIRELRPAHVLIEGPADMNDRLDELLLGHELPVAVFSSYRDSDTRHMSWAPLCDYSPEWLALTEGRAVGAQVRFIDLPAWHPACTGHENRYADAERRYERATQRLCREFAVDNIDALWDHLFELGEPETLAERLATYFELVRGDEDASPGDLAREEYMAGWIDAAVADLTRRNDPSDTHIVVVTGGFHRPALLRRLTGNRTRAGMDTANVGGQDRGAAGVMPDQAAAGGSKGVFEPAGLGQDNRAPFRAHTTGATMAGAGMPPPDLSGEVWPTVPAFPGDGVGGSYLVPFSFQRLDAFAGYQSGMPSPAYYQRLWEHGAQQAADSVTRAVVLRLRERGQAVSTASLIGARTLTVGLSRLRGHESPSRTDVLDGLAGTLITEALDRPLPWTGRGQLRVGTDPVVVEMVAALSGSTVGRLHADTPHPPLVHDAERELARCAVPEIGRFEVDLADAAGLDASRVLHRLRVLDIPGFARDGGPTIGRSPELSENWRITTAEMRLPALIEAGSLGPTCAEAAAAQLGERFAQAGSDTGELATVLFDATLCGLSELTGRIVGTVRGLIESAGAPAGLGQLLTVTLGLWRHDRLFGTSNSPTLAALIDAAVLRLLWLVEGVRGGPAPADDELLKALVAVRDATLHAQPVLSVQRSDVVGVFQRCTATDRPPALRGAAVGVVAVLAPHDGPDIARAVRLSGAPDLLGDFLTGLFALAREQLLQDAGETGSGTPPLLAVLDELVNRFGQEEFLAALPALRLAFAWFPPRERAIIATHLLEQRGLAGSGSALLRLPVDAELLARAQAVESRVDQQFTEYGLMSESCFDTTELSGVADD
ncbi:DUF5682 family protein [Nocardia sp. SYP-A9097]|uniref:DUF5682 family protein n=1 Tax=Nocardia sp. SYP-A9097 TaxID=2663237 RepID=UPI0018914F8F|nr:DUF5682 family protein [Nocardia sp. SYP-A9097]